MARKLTTPRKPNLRPKSIPLIEGTFSLDDARHLLLSLFTYKISFHECKRFGDMERLGHTDTHAERRIDELKENRRALLRILEGAAGRLRIDALVRIRAVK